MTRATVKQSACAIFGVRIFIAADTSRYACVTHPSAHTTHKLCVCTYEPRRYVTTHGDSLYSPELHAQ